MQPRLRLLTPATTLPVTVEDLRAHSNITFSDDDPYLESLLWMATEAVEAKLQRQLMPATWGAYLDEFDYSGVWSNQVVAFGDPSYAPQQQNGTGGIIPLKINPVTSITSFTYVNTAGTTTALVDGTDYTLDKQSEPARLTPYYNKTWPVTRIQPNAIVITFVAGYASASVIPKRILHTIHFLAGELYVNRGMDTDPARMKAWIDRMLHGTQYVGYS